MSVRTGGTGMQPLLHLIIAITVGVFAGGVIAWLNDMITNDLGNISVLGGVFIVVAEGLIATAFAVVTIVIPGTGGLTRIFALGVFSLSAILVLVFALGTTAISGSVVIFASVLAVFITPMLLFSPIVVWTMGRRRV